MIVDADPQSTVNRLQIPTNNEGRLRGTSNPYFLIMTDLSLSKVAPGIYDLITSYVFVHKHIANAEDGNGRIIERKVLWQSDSFLIGERFMENFDLDDGDYRGTCPELLCEFANEHLKEVDDDTSSEEKSSLLAIPNLLAGACETDNYFVSADIQRYLKLKCLSDLGDLES